MSESTTINIPPLDGGRAGPLADLVEQEEGEKTPDRARLLGKEPPHVTTNVAWKGRARQAYITRRDKDHTRRRYLGLRLGNRLEELLGVVIPVEMLSGPDVILVGPEGPVHFCIRERIGRRYEPEYDLFVDVTCPFCGRPNSRAFRTLEELGEVLTDPPGVCYACQTPLAPLAPLSLTEGVGL